MQREELKIRRKYPEESVDTFESVGKGDFKGATFPFGKCANRIKHTNTASVSDKIAIRARKKAEILRTLEAQKQEQIKASSKRLQGRWRA
ncbi:MAG: hypothetical protein EOM59_15930 [Clostridia bacterium]|nr:hypothetical protein [Clostridia bacterium]